MTDDVCCTTWRFICCRIRWEGALEVEHHHFQALQIVSEVSPLVFDATRSKARLFVNFVAL